MIGNLLQSRGFRSLLAIIAVSLAYLLLWPVPIEPDAWQAPQDQGLTGLFAANDQLDVARPISLGTFEGPEDAALGPDGSIYASSSTGDILRFRPDGGDLELFANVGGRPLGIEFDQAGNLLVANAYLGLQRVMPDRTVEILSDTVNGKSILYADDVAVAANGKIYFSDASSKFGAQANGGSFAASLLDILEHGGNGRVLEYDPANKTTRIIIDGLNFANGVAVSADQQYLLINETGSYRVWRYFLDGPRTGESEIVIDNLPGFPDNINNGLNDRFWIGLVSPRDQTLDQLSPHPFLRKLVQRLPESMKPAAKRSSHVIAITGDGEVLMDMQDSEARFPMLTGVLETRQDIYLTTLFGNELGWIRKQDLR